MRAARPSGRRKPNQYHIMVAPSPPTIQRAAEPTAPPSGFSISWPSTSVQVAQQCNSTGKTATRFLDKTRQQKKSSAHSGSNRVHIKKRSRPREEKHRRVAPTPPKSYVEAEEASPKRPKSTIVRQTCSSSSLLVVFEYLQNPARHLISYPVVQFTIDASSLGQDAAEGRISEHPSVLSGVAFPARAVARAGPAGRLLRRRALLLGRPRGGRAVERR